MLANPEATLEFARQNLFKPLGIRDVIWPADPQGFSHGWSDLHLHPRDAAKIGYLWLQQGQWVGQQIVSRARVEDSVKVQVKTGRDDDYGYGWWVVGQEGEYAAIGRGGQRIQVYPALDIILVMIGNNDHFAFRLRFEDDRLVLAGQETDHELGLRLEGRLQTP